MVVTTRLRPLVLATGLLASAVLGGLAAPARALTFNFSFVDGTSAEAKAGFIAAGNWWSALLTDNVTINLTVGTRSLSSGILAQAQSNESNYSLSSFTAALRADASSALDTQAIAHLPTGSNLSLLINQVLDRPAGTSAATPFVDSTGANTQSVRLTHANAKALGLETFDTKVSGCVTAVCDGFLVFSTNYSWDFNRSNGISAGAFDFVGVAAHEIGHALGFVSGVDTLDYNANRFSSNAFTYVTGLDLFRYSAQSTALGVIDWTTDTRSKYFSVDGGATSLGEFSTGDRFGDGQQASHWKDNQGLGLLDPTANPGELLQLTARDVLALDAIGWNVFQATAVPEPGTWALFGAGLGLLGWRARRRPSAAV